MTPTQTSTPPAHAGAADTSLAAEARHDDESLGDAASAESARVLDRLRERKDAVVERMQPQIEAVSSFARNDPTKAVLIAAASGAALMGLIGLVVRSSGRSSGTRSLSSLRDAALGLADRAHSAAGDAIDAAQRRTARAQSMADDAIAAASRRADDAQRLSEAGQTRFADLKQRATDTADDVAETMSDTWKNLRAQAAPMVDKLRPQFESAANYARDEPARAAIGLVTVGAALFGLMALINRSRD
ncbi:MAG: hypothetical protein ABI641_14220 [Caldimonas sp.]